MIDEETRQAIASLYERGMKIRQISRTLGVSRNTVRKVVQGKHDGHPGSSTTFEEHLPLIKETFLLCQGNVVRVAEILADRGMSRIGHADRKARIERPFDYVEKNFLAGRTFTGWQDLNEQALAWCNEKANRKPKRGLGMSPDEAYVREKPHLRRPRHGQIAQAPPTQALPSPCCVSLSRYQGSPIRSL